ncbi:MAG: hypothetical protein ACFFG0_07070 [Candidatus Thorarchaeota archaeon]
MAACKDIEAEIKRIKQSIEEVKATILKIEANLQLAIEQKEEKETLRLIKRQKEGFEAALIRRQKKLVELKQRLVECQKGARTVSPTRNLPSF